MAVEGELSGWEQIAGHLGVSTRTAQGYERDFGLPIKRMPGGKGRVWAVAVELDDWKRNNNPSRLRAAVVSGEPQVEPTPEPKTAALAASPFLPWSRLATVSGLMLIASLAVWLWLPAREPAGCRVNVNTLIAIDDGGNELWRHLFPEGLAKDRNSTDEAVRQNCVAGDLDGDGHRELLFKVSSTNYLIESDALYGFKGGRNINRFLGPRVIGTFQVGRPLVVGTKPDDTYGPPYWIQSNSLVVVPKGKGGDARIVLSSAHYEGAADQVAVLDNTFHLVGEYWHPGHLRKAWVTDLDKNGKPEVILSGVNNGHHAGTMLVFDPYNVSGTSTELPDARFRLTAFGKRGDTHLLGKGSEKASLIFPRTCLAIGKRQPYNRVRSFWLTPDNIGVEVTEDVSETSPDLLLYNLNYQLAVGEIVPQGHFDTTYAALAKGGVCKNALWPKGIEEIRNSVRVIRPDGGE